MEEIWYIWESESGGLTIDTYNDYPYHSCLGVFGTKQEAEEFISQLL